MNDLLDRRCKFKSYPENARAGDKESGGAGEVFENGK